MAFSLEEIVSELRELRRESDTAYELVQSLKAQARVQEDVYDNIRLQHNALLNYARERWGERADNLLDQPAEPIEGFSIREMPL